jgi:hypothetical protein
MSQIQWMPLKCASCSGLLKVPVHESEGIVECPHCQSLLAAPKFVQGTVQLASELPASAQAKPNRTPRPIQEIPTDSSVPRNLKRLSTGGMSAYIDDDGRQSPNVDANGIPMKKVSRYTPPEMIVQDAVTRRPRPEVREEDDAKSESLKGLAKTGDARFAVDPNAPEMVRTRIIVGGGSQGRKKDPTHWDHQESSAGEEKLVAPVMQILLKLKRPMLGVFIAAMVALIVYGIVSMNSKSPHGVPVLDAEEEPKAPEEKTLADDMNEDAKKLAEEAESAFSGFLEAKTIDEKVKFVRDAERVRPLMESYYANRDVGDSFRTVKKIESVYKNFAMSEIVMSDFSEKVIAAERVRNEFKVDWESFVGYSEMSFSEFMEKKPTLPVLFRVKSAGADYFNYGYEQKDYYCISLEEISTQTVIYGYVGKKSELAERMTQNREDLFGMQVLKLKYPEDVVADNMVLIDDFVQRGWVIREMEERELTLDDIGAVPGVEKKKKR